MPPAERGRAEHPVLGAEEVLASLEDRERDAMAMEADGHARLGTVRLRNLEEEQLTVEHVEQEVDELTSTVLMNTEKEGEFSLQNRLREMRSAMDTGGLAVTGEGQIQRSPIPSLPKVRAQPSSIDAVKILPTPTILNFSLRLSLSVPMGLRRTEESPGAQYGRRWS